MRVTHQKTVPAKVRVEARRKAELTHGSCSLVDQALVAIGRWIVDGRYTPGQTLPTEHEICRELGIGRNAIREAIKMLVSKGLVRTVRRLGMIVKPRAEWNMLDPALLSWTLANPEIRETLLEDLASLRQIIEPEVAALAAERASTVDILRIYEAFEDMEAHGNDFELAVEADIVFHKRLFDGAHHQLLSSIVPAFALLLRSDLEIAFHTGNFIAGLEHHRRVMEAIHRRDSEEARAQMRLLVQKNVKDLGGVSARRHRPRRVARRRK